MWRTNKAFTRNTFELKQKEQDKKALVERKKRDFALLEAFGESASHLVFFLWTINAVFLIIAFRRFKNILLTYSKSN